MLHPIQGHNNFCLECSGIEFSESCREAACSGVLCNLFEEGIAKCHTLCQLGPMNDDCVNCAYLPQEMVEKTGHFGIDFLYFCNIAFVFRK